MRDGKRRFFRGVAGSIFVTRAKESRWRNIDPLSHAHPSRRRRARGKYTLTFNSTRYNAINHSARPRVFALDGFELTTSQTPSRLHKKRRSPFVLDSERSESQCLEETSSNKNEFLEQVPIRRTV